MGTPQGDQALKAALSAQPIECSILAHVSLEPVPQHDRTSSSVPQCTPQETICSGLFAHHREDFCSSQIEIGIRGVTDGVSFKQRQGFIKLPKSGHLDRSTVNETWALC
jgi:hypothetical protein